MTKAQAELEIEALAEVFGIATTGFDKFYKAANDNDFWAAFNQHINRIFDEPIRLAKDLEKSCAELNEGLAKLNGMVSLERVETIMDGMEINAKANLAASESLLSQAEIDFLFGKETEYA